MAPFSETGAIVFSPRRDRGGCVLVCGTLCIAWGLFCLDAVGMHLLSVMLLVMGGVAGLLGWETLRKRVTVDAAGFAKAPGLLTVRFRIPWDAVESWKAVPAESDSCTFRIARFKVRGRRWDVEVWDSEAWRPSFDGFLAEVRAHIGNKETV